MKQIFILIALYFKVIYSPKGRIKKSQNKHSENKTNDQNVGKTLKYFDKKITSKRPSEQTYEPCKQTKTGRFVNSPIRNFTDEKKVSAQTFKGSPSSSTSNVVQPLQTETENLKDPINNNENFEQKSLDSDKKEIEKLANEIQAKAIKICEDLIVDSQKYYNELFLKIIQISSFLKDKKYKIADRNSYKNIYSLLFEKLKKLLFDEKDSTLVFSQEKSEKFFSLGANTIKKYLKECGISDYYDYLSIREYNYMKTFYKQIPELLIVVPEVIKSSSPAKVFFYIAAINILSLHYVNYNNDLFKAQLIEFIKKSKVILIRTNDNNNKKDEHIPDINTCGNEHLNILEILLNCFHYKGRRFYAENEEIKVTAENLFAIKHLKVVCLIFLYRHLMLTLLFANSKYDLKPINSLISSIEDSNSCYGCVLETFFDLISDTESYSIGQSSESETK